MTKSTAVNSTYVNAQRSAFGGTRGQGAGVAIFTEAITAGTIMAAASGIRDASAGLFFDDMKIIAGEQTRLIGRSKAG